MGSEMCIRDRDKSTQTYFPADMGPLTEQTALEEQERKWQSRLSHFNKDVRQLLMNRFWRWEEDHIKAVESTLSGFRASRMRNIRNIHRYLDRTHCQDVETEERPMKRRRRMSH